MDIDFRKLLEAPRLRALFLEDSGLEERELVKLLEADPKEAWGMINPEGVLEVYYQSISHIIILVHVFNLLFRHLFSLIFWDCFPSFHIITVFYWFFL
jgi:hypothetical protein